MKIDKDTVMPEKWRNRFFKYTAGGYDGCIWHVAFVLIDGKGTPYYIGNDGAGGIRDLENTLEREFVRHEEVSWDHEFEEHDVSTKEKVTELCKYLAKAYRDVSVQAGVANMLVIAGYDGAGCVCSDCGEFFETTDYFYDMEEGGGFRYCIDREAYQGCEGVAVDYTRILCDDCRGLSECPACCELDLPLAKGKDGKMAVDTDHMDFEAEFGFRLCGICEYCWVRFLRRHDKDELEWHGPGKPGTPYEMLRVPYRLVGIVEALEEAHDRKDREKTDVKYAVEVFKYFDWKRRMEGLSDAEAFELVRKQIFSDPRSFLKLPYGFVEKLTKNLILPLVSDYWPSEVGERGIEPEDVRKEWSDLIHLGKENEP